MTSELYDISGEMDQEMWGKTKIARIRKWRGVSGDEYEQFHVISDGDYWIFDLYLQVQVIEKKEGGSKMEKKFWQVYRRDGDHLIDVAIVRATSADDAAEKASVLGGEMEAEAMVEVPWVWWDNDCLIGWDREWIREGVSRDWPVAYRSPSSGTMTLFRPDGMRYYVDDLRRGDGFFAGDAGDAGDVVVLVPLSEYIRVSEYLGSYCMGVRGRVA